MTKKKKGLRLEITGGENKGISPDWWGEIYLYKDGRKIGNAGFTINEFQITVDTLKVKEDDQKQGYGRLIMETIKSIAIFKNLPVVLYSAMSAEKFYLKIGFKKCKDYENIKDISGSTSDLDMIWLPKKIVKKERIVIAT
jgi:hypothetical protein